MTEREPSRVLRMQLLLVILMIGFAASAPARPRALPPSPPQSSPSPSAARKTTGQDDSVAFTTAKDLLLRRDGEHKAEAVARFVEGLAFEENGEMDKALASYRKVLDVDPGQAELASRVAALLAREEQFPEAIDILKDTIKANPKAAEPLLQLGFIYSKYLRRTDQALEYVNQAIALNPGNIDAYQRFCEIALADGDDKKALEGLDRAAKVTSNDPTFWTQLGKLYASILIKPDVSLKPEDLERINHIFKKAAEHAGDNTAALRDIADYYAGTQQLKEAIPFYLRLVDLEPDDTTSREKLAAGLALTNKRDQAIAMLEELVKEQPDKYQTYDLLAGLLDDSARALEREKKSDQARVAFGKAAANYEQSTIVNPRRASPYLHLADLLLGPLKDSEKAVKVLTEARTHFPDAPEIVYYLAIAQREAKHSQQAIATFEEALHQAEVQGTEIANARFFFDYGAAAEQAGLYDKAADLFKKSIALDPGNAADACNYLAYMWAEQGTHLEEAEQMVKQALQFDSNNGAYLDTLGWIEFREAKFDQALSDLQRAAQKIARDDPVVFEHIGDAYAKLNKPAQALDAWQKALNLNPQDKKLADKIDNAKTKVSQSQRSNGNPLH